MVTITGRGDNPKYNHHLSLKNPPYKIKAPTIFFGKKKTWRQEEVDRPSTAPAAREVRQFFGEGFLGEGYPQYRGKSTWYIGSTVDGSEIRRSPVDM